MTIKKKQDDTFLIGDVEWWIGERADGKWVAGCTTPQGEDITSVPFDTEAEAEQELERGLQRIIAKLEADEAAKGKT